MVAAVEHGAAAAAEVEGDRLIPGGPASGAGRGAIDAWVVRCIDSNLGGP